MIQERRDDPKENTYIAVAQGWSNYPLRSITNALKSGKKEQCPEMYRVYDKIPIGDRTFV